VYLFLRVLESDEVLVGRDDLLRGPQELRLVPEGLSLFFHFLFESFLEVEYGLVVMIDILYAFPELYKVLDDVLGVLKLDDSFSILGPFVHEVL
jgi:hypothetical protein